MRSTTPTDDSVLIDASALIASFAVRDALHLQVKPLFVKFLLGPTVLHLPDYVWSETLTRVKRKEDTEIVQLFEVGVQYLLRKGKMILLWTDPDTFRTAQRIFHATPTPKTFSFTDAVIAAHMKRKRIKTLFTFDRDFRRFGITLAP